MLQKRGALLEESAGASAGLAQDAADKSGAAASGGVESARAPKRRKPVLADTAIRVEDADWRHKYLRIEPDEATAAAAAAAAAAALAAAPPKAR